MESDKSHPIEQLIKVMAKLRDPDGGCPWDLEQDFKSIAPYTIEEAYEVADAIDRQDMKDLREELGDLLLQPIYHAQMASETGEFTIEDVINDVTDKMISRHPHVFGDKTAQNAADVDKIWDERKKLEQKGKEGIDIEKNALDGVTKGLPALLRAEKLQKKAAKTGFEWPTTDQVFDKIEEEIVEMRQALANKDKENQAEELGDILFVVANLSRMLGINPETALRDANNKFEKRFKELERNIKVKYKVMNDASLQEMEAEWQNVKAQERTKKAS